MDSIDLEDIREGRKNRVTYHWFLDEIASLVVGTLVFEKVKYVKPLNEWLLPSLEGFCLLCIKNYFDKIKSTVKKEERKNCQCTVDC